MKRFLGIAAAVAIGLGALGCESFEKTRTINNVVRVFMNYTCSFTFVIQEPGSQELRFLTVHNCGYRLKVVADVPDGQKMWIKYVWSSAVGDKDLEIHVHSVKSIEGGARPGSKNDSGGPVQTIE